MPRVGLISDTHGLLRPEALDFLRGCEHIVHAGDVTDPSVLDALSRLAPLTVVRGNNDRGDWAKPLRETALVRFGEIFVYVVHDLAEMDIAPGAAGVHVVVSGHSHQPMIERRDGVLYINPGSAGPRRFKLPVTAAELSIAGDEISARIVPLLLPKSA